MKKILITIVFLFFTAGCLTDVQNDKLLSTETETIIESSAEPEETNGGNAPSTNGNEISDENEDATIPTDESTFSNEPITLSESDQMPIFIEIIQTTILSTGSSQAPNIGVGPSVYFYQPESNLLMVHPSVILDPNTELLIGENNILQTPDQTYERKVILQYPTEQFTLIQVAGYKPATETLTLVFGGETFSLSPGESWTSKQVAEGNTPTLITVVTNFGKLNGIELLSTDGTSR